MLCDCSENDKKLRAEKSSELISYCVDSLTSYDHTITIGVHRDPTEVLVVRDEMIRFLPIFNSEFDGAITKFDDDFEVIGDLIEPEQSSPEIVYNSTLEQKNHYFSEPIFSPDLKSCYLFYELTDFDAATGVLTSHLQRILVYKENANGWKLGGFYCVWPPD